MQRNYKLSFTDKLISMGNVNNRTNSLMIVQFYSPSPQKNIYIEENDSIYLKQLKNEGTITENGNKI